MSLNRDAVYEIMSDFKGQSLTALILLWNSFLSPQRNNDLHEYRDVWGNPSVLGQNIILAVCNEKSCGLQRWETAVPSSITVNMRLSAESWGHCKLGERETQD